MKKLIVVGLIVAVLLIIVGGAGLAYAQFRGLDNEVVASTTIQNGNGIITRTYGPGSMMGSIIGGRGGEVGRGGMMGGSGFGPGSMMGERGFGQGMGMMGGQGMMGGRGLNQAEGPLHDYMISAFADAIGLTVDELETRISNGETLREIALAQGKTEAELPALMTDVRQAALDKAVADGVITQAQADFMKERMSNYQGTGFGPGYGVEGCPMFDGDEQQQP